MENVFILFSLLFLVTLLLGIAVERLKVPWIFAALVLGAAASIQNPFSPITTSSQFLFLSELGMYFLLFIIGFEMDLKGLLSQKGFFARATFSVIFMEAFLGTLLIHYIFNLDWFISFIVSISFATVGEAVLVPILDGLGLMKTKLGQLIMGIGVFDDILEVLILVLAVGLVSTYTGLGLNTGIVIGALGVLFMLTALFANLKKQGNRFIFLPVETLFLFTLIVLFLFIGIGEYAEATPLAAILAGISLKTFIPEKRLGTIESEVRTMCYGFFAPIFLFSVGSSMNLELVVRYPLYVIAISLVSMAGKVAGSVLATTKELGLQGALALGVGLSVRFSTSLVIVKILLDNGIIHEDLYTAIISSSIILTLAIPMVLPNLLPKPKPHIS